MSYIEKTKNKIKSMEFNNEQYKELSKLVEFIINELDNANNSDDVSTSIYNNIKENTNKLIEGNVFTDKDIPKLVKINNDLNFTTRICNNNNNDDDNKGDNDNDMNHTKSDENDDSLKNDEDDICYSEDILIEI